MGHAPGTQDPVLWCEERGAGPPPGRTGSLQGFVSPGGIRSLFPSCGAAASSLVPCSTASSGHHKMTTAVVPANIRQPIQTASVKEGIEWLPELRRPCVPGSGYSEDVGLAPSTSQLPCPPYRLILRQVWPCGGLSWASIATPASQERKDAPPCRYFCKRPKGGLSSLQLGPVLGPSSVTVVGGGSDWTSLGGQ